MRPDLGGALDLIKDIFIKLLFTDRNKWCRLVLLWSSELILLFEIRVSSKDDWQLFYSLEEKIEPKRNLIEIVFCFL